MLAVVSGSATQTGGSVTITHPATAPAGGWATFNLTACDKSNPTSCPVDNIACPAAQGSGPTTCQLKGLEPDTVYEVKVR